MSWSFPRAPRAMDRRSLQLMAGLNQHGARSVATRRGRGGPLGGTFSTVRQSEGWFGSGVALRAVRRQAMTAKQGCSLQDSPALVPAAYNTITQPRFILYIKPPSPQAPRPSPKPLFEYSETARKWPKSQISLAALDAPRRRG